MAQALPAIIALVGAGVSAKVAHDQGTAVKKEAEAQSRREGDAARFREIERRRELVAALANQAAVAGAAGIGPDLSVMTSDIKAAENDILYDKANTRTEQAMLRARGKNAKRIGTLGAGASLLQGIGSAYSLAPGKPPADPGLSGIARRGGGP